ncbi:MAG: DUF1460 domain-containing protein [Gemmatimonadales bacterium]|nr:MAG: DUF1460 domain-containing protein [Gemmatimonadales bacterium]
MKKILYTVFVMAAMAGLVLAPAGCGANDDGPNGASGIPAQGEPPADAPTVDSDGAATPPTDAPDAGGATAGASISPGFTGPVLDDLPPVPAEAEEGLVAETERDWAIARGMVDWIRAQRLESLPTGEVMAILSATFVGAPYEPGTLELPGEERLVVNLRTFDCVTLVEHALVLARLAADPAVDPDNEDAFGQAYRTELTDLRYRGGQIDGYPSRLHYFSEWIEQATDRGVLRDVTEEVAASAGALEMDDRPIHFMTSNPQAYRQLDEDPALLDDIRAVEERLSAVPRPFIPQDRIAQVEDGIENGDILAAVSSVDGLDIAHTGLALRHEGRLHMIHAPLVGDSVELTGRPLAERMQDISGQMGVRVLRPLAPGTSAPAGAPPGGTP